ncbi:MAG TPA: hypothetical protein VMP12_08820 [Candidatus Sulfotelmatobacter sp.]|nr:hypothetical protein [Candidatus Sulfotelmatobacter sp.]
MEDEPRLQSSKNVTALDALGAPDGFDSSTATSDATGAASDTSSPAAVSEKPQAPAPKIPTDSDVAQQSSTGATGNSSQQKPTGPPSNPTGQQDDNPKRILGFIPNFQTKDDTPGNQPPLTVKQKYILALHQTVDFSAHIGNAFQAALQQASDTQPHYGEGWGPYAERFGAAEGDQATSSFFIFGFLPSILHDDPRYFRKGPSYSIWKRLTYSATRTVITRKDSGEPTFNIPQVAGQLFQQSISTIYYPPEDRTAGRVFQNWATTLAYNSAYNVVKEFYPDFLHLVFHRRNHAADPSSQPAPQNH